MAYSIDDFYTGQRVRIRDWDDLAEEFGVDENGNINTPGAEFNEECSQYCGFEGTIQKINSANLIFLDERFSVYFYPCDLEPIEIGSNFDDEAFKQMLGMV